MHGIINIKLAEELSFLAVNPHHLHSNTQYIAAAKRF